MNEYRDRRMKKWHKNLEEGPNPARGESGRLPVGGELIPVG